MRLLLLSCSFALACWSGCTKGVPDISNPIETATDRIEGSIAFGTVQVAIVKNTVGSVLLKWGGVEDSIRWMLDRKVNGENELDAKAFLSSIALTWEFGRDTLRFSPQTPTGIIGYSFSTLVTLGIPFRMPCVIDGVQGTTTVADLGANVVIRNAHAVVVQRLNASCDIISLDGGVSCEVALPPAGSCTISAVRGSITLKVPTNTSANVTARTSNGSISYTNLTFTELNQQTGTFTGKLGAGNAHVRVETNEGNIVIQGVIP